MNEWIVKRNDNMRTNTILVLYWRLTMISFTVFPNSLSRSLSCFLFLFEIFRRSILIFSSYTHIVLRKNDGSSFAMPHFALAMAVKKSWIIQVFSPLCFFFFHPNGHISFHLYNGTYPIFFTPLFFDFSIGISKRRVEKRRSKKYEEQKYKSEWKRVK